MQLSVVPGPDVLELWSRKGVSFRRWFTKPSNNKFLPHSDFFLYLSRHIE